ncbi:MAG: hypothetical protein RR482_04645 [Clostridia bacterium]
MKKMIAVLLACVMMVGTFAALAETSKETGEDVRLKKGTIVVYDDIQYQQVEGPYRGAKVGQSEKVVTAAVLKSLKEDPTIIKYAIIAGMNKAGELTGKPIRIKFKGENAKLIVVIIEVTYADGTKRYERWNFVMKDGETAYKLRSVSISVQ